MVNFISRWLGGERGEKVVEAASTKREVRQEDPGIIALREINLGKVLEGFLCRPATELEFEKVRQMMIDPETGNIVAIPGEEMLQRIKELAPRLRLQPTPEPENVIDGKEFTPRGNRQVNFERGLANGFGGDLSQEDLDIAQKYIANDPEGKGRWSTMLGEEAKRYGEKIARRILVDRLRQPRKDVQGYDEAEAAK